MWRGAELEVLLGASKLLKEPNLIILLENPTIQCDRPVAIKYMMDGNLMHIGVLMGKNLPSLTPPSIKDLLENTFMFQEITTISYMDSRTFSVFKK